jgi:hypothetical protein
MHIHQIKSTNLVWFGWDRRKWQEKNEMGFKKCTLTAVSQADMQAYR